ncbi:MAG: hypothetical protein V1774_04440 [Candidatus Eisenbacteria bacterium]
MKSQPTDQEILAAIQPFIKEGRLACRDALATAAALETPPAWIGRVCDAEGIRIVNCQLGCFGLKRRRSKSG